MADREPIGAHDRHKAEMTDPRPAQGANHARHDLFVIAAAADRDAEPTARAAADAQMRDCLECAALFADLQAISTGLADLPRELPAPRDFRISPERAASLRRRGWRAAFDGIFRSPSLRPFGNALATIGFAGLLLTVAVPGLMHLGGSTASAPAAIPAPVAGGPAASAGTVPELSTSGSGKSGPTSAPADNGAAGGPASQASQAPSATAAGMYAAQTAPPSRDAGGAGGATDQSTGSPLAPAGPDLLSFLPWLSLGALLVGIALLGLARFGGRART